MIICKNIGIKCAVLTSESFTYYVINVYIPRARAKVLTTPPETPKSADVICERPDGDSVLLTGGKQVHLDQGVLLQQSPGLTGGPGRLLHRQGKLWMWCTGEGQ